jgi:hypothetical protein
MQQDRATGTLSLESDGHNCALHFLFGHLFHAVGDGAEGELAVLSVLSWNEGAYTFNPRAKLPPEETINSSTEDLVAQWQRTGSEQASRAQRASEPAPPAAAPAPPGSANSAPAEVTGRRTAGDWAEVTPSARPGREPEEGMRDIPPFQTPAAQTRPAQFKADTPPARVGQPSGGSGRPLAPLPPPARSSGSAPTTQSRPTGSGPSAPPKPAAAGASRLQLSVLVPMPGGPALHSGLKASFLNFPMLLKTLSQDGFSGYVSIVGEGTSRSAGHILFRDGDVLQAQHRADGNYRRGKTAMQEVIRTVGLGQGLIDAVEVPAELVASVSALIVASTAFVNLPARIVDFDALLEYVEEQRLSGGVLVGHGDQVAVALLTEGTVKGSYSSTAPDLTEGPQVASAACSEREARIDVVSGPSQAMTPIDLAEIG